MEHSRLLKFLVPGHDNSQRMAEAPPPTVKVQFDYQNPDNVQAEVPGTQKLREVDGSTSQDLKNGGYTITRTSYQEVKTIEGVKTTTVVLSETKQEKDKIEERKPKTRIPKLKFRQAAEKVRSERRNKKEKELQLESLIPAVKANTKLSRISKIPALTSKPIVVKRDVRELTESEPDDEFEKIYEEIAGTASEIDTNILDVKIEDPEKLEIKFEEIIHDYDENKIQPIKVDVSRIPRIPRLRRRTEELPKITNDKTKIRNPKLKELATRVKDDDENLGNVKYSRAVSMDAIQDIKKTKDITNFASITEKVKPGNEHYVEYTVTSTESIPKVNERSVVKNTYITQTSKDVNLAITERNDGDKVAKAKEHIQEITANNEGKKHELNTKLTTTESKVTISNTEPEIITNLHEKETFIHKTGLVTVTKETKLTDSTNIVKTINKLPERYETVITTETNNNETPKTKEITIVKNEVTTEVTKLENTDLVKQRIYTSTKPTNSILSTERDEQPNNSQTKFTRELKFTDNDKTNTHLYKENKIHKYVNTDKVTGNNAKIPENTKEPKHAINTHYSKAKTTKEDKNHGTTKNEDNKLPADKFNTVTNTKADTVSNIPNKTRTFRSSTYAISKLAEMSNLTENIEPKSTTEAKAVPITNTPYIIAPNKIKEIKTNENQETEFKKSKQNLTNETLTIKTSVSNTLDDNINQNIHDGKSDINVKETAEENIENTTITKEITLNTPINNKMAVTDKIHTKSNENLNIEQHSTTILDKISSVEDLSTYNYKNVYPSKEKRFTEEIKDSAKEKIKKEIEKISSKDEIDDLPKKRSILSKIALFERQEPSDDLVKRKNRPANIEIKKTIAEKVHVHTPKIVEEVLKPVHRNLDVENNEIKTKIVYQETIGTFEKKSKKSNVNFIKVSETVDRATSPIWKLDFKVLSNKGDSPLLVDAPVILPSPQIDTVENPKTITPEQRNISEEILTPVQRNFDFKDTHDWRTKSLNKYERSKSYETNPNILSAKVETPVTSDIEIRFTGSRFEFGTNKIDSPLDNGLSTQQNKDENRIREEPKSPRIFNRPSTGEMISKFEIKKEENQPYRPSYKSYKSRTEKTPVVEKNAYEFKPNLVTNKDESRLQIEKQIQIPISDVDYKTVEISPNVQLNKVDSVLQQYKDERIQVLEKEHVFEITPKFEVHKDENLLHERIYHSLDPNLNLSNDNVFTSSETESYSNSKKLKIITKSQSSYSTPILEKESTFEYQLNDQQNKDENSMQEQNLNIEKESRKNTEERNYHSLDPNLNFSNDVFSSKSDTYSNNVRLRIVDVEKRSKSLADPVTSKASVSRAKSVDLLQNVKEMPGKLSVLEKIALFEKKITSVRMVSPTVGRERVEREKRATGELNEQEYCTRIAELNGVVMGRVEIPTVKLRDGSSMPVIAVGTALLHPRLTTEIVEAAITLGYRAIDTAYIYGNEKLVGRAIQNKIDDGTVKRGDLFIIGKLWSTFHRTDLVEKACRRSLDELGLDYFDLYLIHNPMSFKEGENPVPKLASVIQYSKYDYLDAWFGMEKLTRLGLAKTIGVSNFNSTQIQRIMEKGKVKPAVNQVECHPYFNQSKLHNFCDERDIVLSCFSVLGSKGTPAEYKSNGAAVIDDPLVQVMASGLGITPAQLLIKYQIQCGRSAVVKASTAAHLWDNLQALKVNLTIEQMNALNALNKNRRTFTFAGMGDTHKNYPFSMPF